MGGCRGGTNYKGCARQGVWRGYGETKEMVCWFIAKKEGGTRQGLWLIHKR